MEAKKKRRKKSVASDVCAPDVVLDSPDHVTAFEMRLADFLLHRCAATVITVADVKDIVWNEQDSNLVSRMTFELAEQNPKTKFEDILQVTNDAWNHFPHKRLNGLAPRDMVERIRADGDFTPEARPDFYTLFADRFPETPRVVKMRGHDWSWEYPAVFHTRRSELSSMHEKDEELMSEGNSGSDFENIERELLRKVSIVAAKATFDENPLMFDAAIMLARDAFEEDETALTRRILETSIYEARKLVPPVFSIGTDLLPWGFVDNRPFLLLLGEYATLVEVIDGPQKAISHYQELLALNPNDNQGIREILATAYVKTNRLEELLELDKQYPDDMMAGLKVGALLALYKLGRLDEARSRIPEMKERFLHVLQEILKTDHPQPELIPGRIKVGGDDEAWFYWQHQGTFWMATPGARDFIREAIA